MQIPMAGHPFPKYNSKPEEYRILMRDWETVENVLNASGKFGYGIDAQGNETRGAYDITHQRGRVGLADDEVIMLRTHDPEVKQLLGELWVKAGTEKSPEEDKLHQVTPEDRSTYLPRLSPNSIRPLGEIAHYEEMDAVLVAPMPAKDVRAAFERYNEEREELNGSRPPGRQLPELLERRHYALKEMGKDGQIHTIVIPSGHVQWKEEFDRAINSGEIPLGKLYSLAQLPEEAGKKKLRR